MNHRTLQDQLEYRRSHLLQRLGAIEADFARGRNDDWAEQAQERENEETLTAIERESMAELRQINSALQRLQAGQYGQCVNCGRTIPEARLRALPHTAQCIRCAQGAPADAH